MRHAVRSRTRWKRWNENTKLKFKEFILESSKRFKRKTQLSILCRRKMAHWENGISNWMQSLDNREKTIVPSDISSATFGSKMWNLSSLILRRLVAVKCWRAFQTNSPPRTKKKCIIKLKIFLVRFFF